MATGRRAFEGRSQGVAHRGDPRARARRDRRKAPSGSSTPGAAPTGARPAHSRASRRTPRSLQTAHDARSCSCSGSCEGAGLSKRERHRPGAGAAGTTREGAKLPWAIAAVSLLAAAAFAAFAVPRLGAEARLSFQSRHLTSGHRWLLLAAPVARRPDVLFRVTTRSESSAPSASPPTRRNPGRSPERRVQQRAYWSPDGREIVFCAGTKMQRLAVASGTPDRLSRARGPDPELGREGGRSCSTANTPIRCAWCPRAAASFVPATHRSRERRDRLCVAALPADGEHFVFIGNARRTARATSASASSARSSRSCSESRTAGWNTHPEAGCCSCAALRSSREARPFGRQADRAADRSSTTFAWARRSSASISRTGILAYARGTTVAGTELRVTDRAGQRGGQPFRRRRSGEPG